jgi:hypothetical protein
MKRIRKAILILIRDLSYRYGYLRIYYWSAPKVFDLRLVNLFTDRFYCRLYRLSTKMVEKKKCLKTANWLQHRIPFDLRCDLA